MKRMHLKKYKKRKILNKIGIVCILLLLAITYIFKIFNEKALPLFIEYSKVETKKIATLIISSTITDEVAKNTTLEDLFITTKDNNGNIQSIDFNSSKVNSILVSASNLLEQNLNYLETGQIDKLSIQKSTLSNYNQDKLKKGIIFEIPSGIMFNNQILSNIFPMIPVKLHLVGNIVCKIKTDIESYGINNALIKVNIEVSVDIKILLPFISEDLTFVIDIPIIMKIMEGRVPSYYMDGFLKTPIVNN